MSIRSSAIPSFFVSLLLLCLLGLAAGRPLDLLPTTTTSLADFGIDQSRISTSGLSSGGCFATQLHVSNSKTFMGAAIVAGAPYWCANDNAAIAYACIDTPDVIDVNELISATEFARLSLSIDDPSNLRSSKVYLYSGLDDTVVAQGTVLKVQQYYEHYISAQNAIVAVLNISSQHAWITDDSGNACQYLGSPYLNNCQYDMGGELLEQIYGPLKQPTSFNQSNFISFDQSNYTPLHANPATISMAPLGFAYVPTGCQNSSTNCWLHVCLHGCEQDYLEVGSAFVVYNGLNEWAEANNIIVLYPQVQKTVGVNPDGCWDWFGYTGPDYATKLGPQIQTVMNMVQSMFK